jgi:hypothetical protein
MEQFYVKLKYIFLPFLIIGICTISIYTFLNWLIIVKLNIFKIDEQVTEFLIPMALPWIPLLIWLMPRIKLLKLNKTGRRNPVAAILMLTWIAIGVPLILSQAYMVTATGKLTKLDYMSQVDYRTPSKYYMVKHFYVAKNMVHLRTIFQVSGKYNRDFDMTIYAPIPVFDHLFPDTNMIIAMRDNLNAKGLVIINGKLSNMQVLKRLPADSIRKMRYLNPSLVMPKYGDTGKFGGLLVITRGFKLKSESPPPKIEPAAWLAVKYTKTINNHLTSYEKDQRYRLFLAHCDSDFRHKRFDGFVYLDRIPYSKDLKYYLDAIKLKGDVVAGFPIILAPVYDSYANKNGDKLAWIFGLFGVGAAIFLIILSLIKLRSGDINSILKL